MPAASPTGAPSTVPSISPPSVVGAGGFAGILAAAARLGAKADIDHHLPDYLRTREHGRELLGERDKTVPPALGADETPPSGPRRAVPRPQSSSHERDLLGDPEKTVPQAIGADQRPALDTTAAAGLDAQGRRHAARYGRELLGEPEKTVPPAIGADEGAAGSAGTEITDAIPRPPAVRPILGSGAPPRDDRLPDERTGDCSLSLPRLDPPVSPRFRPGQPGMGHDDAPVHVPPVHGAPAADEYR